MLLTRSYYRGIPRNVAICRIFAPRGPDDTIQGFLIRPHFHTILKKHLPSIVQLSFHYRIPFLYFKLYRFFLFVFWLAGFGFYNFSSLCLFFIILDISYIFGHIMLTVISCLCVTDAHLFLLVFMISKNCHHVLRLPFYDFGLQTQSIGHTRHIHVLSIHPRLHLHVKT